MKVKISRLQYYPQSVREKARKALDEENNASFEAQRDAFVASVARDAEAEVNRRYFEACKTADRMLMAILAEDEGWGRVRLKRLFKKFHSMRKSIIKDMMGEEYTDTVSEMILERHGIDCDAIIDEIYTEAGE